MHLGLRASSVVAFLALLASKGIQKKPNHDFGDSDSYVDTSPLCHHASLHSCVSALGQVSRD